jgi:hypothetical protein
MTKGRRKFICTVKIGVVKIKHWCCRKYTWDDFDLIQDLNFKTYYHILRVLSSHETSHSCLRNYAYILLV